MNFYSRKWIKPGDLNSHGTLFGGSLLQWIDEEAAIFASCQIDSKSIVTKYMSEINFVSSARQGDIIEMGMEVVKFGTTSFTLRCEVRNKLNQQVIIRIEKMTFVHIDENGKPKPHGVTEEKIP